MILAIVLLGYFMILLDTSIVVTGLPVMGKELGLTALQLSWVQNSYTLVFGGLLLLAARTGDLFGRRRMLLIGLALFSVSSLLIGLAPSAAWLIGGRLAQGAGTAILAPTTLALIMEHFSEGPERTKATSAYGAVLAVKALPGRDVAPRGELFPGGALATIGARLDEVRDRAQPVAAKPTG